MEDRAKQTQERQESIPDEEQGHSRPRAGRGVPPRKTQPLQTLGRWVKHSVSVPSHPLVLHWCCPLIKPKWTPTSQDTEHSEKGREQIQAEWPINSTAAACPWGLTVPCGGRVLPSEIKPLMAFPEFTPTSCSQGLIDFTLLAGVKYSHWEAEVCYRELIHY